jgi:hypothetical protein
MGIRPKRPKNGGRARRPCKKPASNTHHGRDKSTIGALTFQLRRPEGPPRGKFFGGAPVPPLTHRDKDVMVMACLRVWPAVIHKENISALIEKSFIFLRCPVNIYSGWMWRGPGLFDLLEARYD